MFVIAGATGRVGGAVADQLLARGEQVRVIARDEGRAHPWRLRGAEVTVGSLADEATLARALVGARAFFTLLPEDPHAAEVHGPRLRIADALAGAVTASDVTHVVFLSAAAAVLAEGNGVASDLHHAEAVLRATGRPISAVRAAYFQENVLSALEPARRQGIYPCFLPSADFAFPTVATRDVARFAVTSLLEAPATSEILDVVGPMSSTRQLADALGRAIGKTLQVVELPAPAHVGALTQAGLSPAFASALAEMFACFASGRVTPAGDRLVAGTTTIDQTLAERLGGRA